MRRRLGFGFFIITFPYALLADDDEKFKIQYTLRQHLLQQSDSLLENFAASRLAAREAEGRHSMLERMWKFVSPKHPHSLLLWNQRATYLSLVHRYDDAALVFSHLSEITEHSDEKRTFHLLSLLSASRSNPDVLKNYAFSPSEQSFADWFG